MARISVAVPMIDRHPIDLGSKVASHLAHEVAREGAKVGKLNSIIGRDDEAKVMAVALASFCESARIRLVAGPVKHFPRRAVAGDAVAAQIRKMR